MRHPPRLMLGILAALLLLAGCGDGHDHKDHDHGDDHKDHARSHKDDDHGHDHAGPNAHLWLDPVRTKGFIEAAAPRLARILDAAEKGDPKRKPVIVASIFPLGSLIEELVGNRAAVKVLLPSGGSPHGFDATPQVVKTIVDADALVVVGSNLDPWAEKAARNVAEKTLPVLRMTDTPSLSSEEAFGKAGPKPPHSLEIEQKALTTKLDALDARLKTVLCPASVGGRIKTLELVTFHNAFDLFAQRYGLIVVAHLTEMDLPTGAEVTPAAIREALAAVKEHNLKVLYAEPQYPDTALKAIAEATGAAILRLDDLGGPDRPGYRSYFEMMESNLKTLVDGQAR